MQKLYIKFNQLIKNLDLFGQPIGLHMNDSLFFKTGFGGFMSLISITLVLLFFNSSINLFINKEEVLVKQDRRYSIDPFKSQLNTDRFMFMTSILPQTSTLQFLKNPYFNITMEQVSVVREGSTRKRKSYYIELEPCQDYHFENLNSETDFVQIYKQFGTDFLCPTLKSIMFIEGLFQSSTFSYISLKVVPCQESSDQNRKWIPQSCATKEQIQNVIQQKGFHAIGFYHTNFVLNPDKSKNYFTNYISDKLYFTFVPKQMAKVVDIYFQDIEVNTDQSLIPFKKIESQFFLTQESNDIRETTELGREDTAFVTLTLRKSPYVTKINRSFKKISQLMSELGGFIQIIFAATRILMMNTHEDNPQLSEIEQISNKQEEIKKLNLVKYDQLELRKQKMDFMLAQQIFKRQIMWNIQK
ncbi:hypothetical protein IMG5_152080 [Ichthyophthirius multifiliis]|uniref:Transmembrane protein n=1 Tax=Ichthyophthirius multifiliis TaxID=5932 RepID=G0QYT2_ICHMU|nr:hypothetical protein IMG5_152080 [Ichthyophthirius multifiliis]EGR29607.1 hypothetical protein IMG5_152080 [Ichthyophthirius multifiliis]|eukprot:XP_004030843.1 hypothetical protein IMG5_152080 [Ichthyophthirius multifiliis]